MSYFYKAYDLNFKSEFELNGLIQTEASNSIDVDLTLGEVSTDGFSLKKGFLFKEVLPDGILFGIEGVANFFISKGRKIIVTPKTLENELWQIHLLNTAMSILLMQRGLIVFQGSAVAKEGKASLLIGPTGVGKSSIAMALNKIGYDLISDELCAIKISSEGTAKILSGDQTIKLWEDATEYFDLKEKSKIRKALSCYKIHFKMNNSALPISNIFILQIKGTSNQNAEILPLDLLSQIKLLNNNSIGKTRFKGFGIQQSSFNSISLLAQNTPVCHFVRPYSKMDINSVARTLDESLKS